MALQPMATGVAWAVKLSVTVLCTILHISTVILYRHTQGRVKMAPPPVARLERDLIAASAAKVRKMPIWLRSWANFSSLLSLYSHRNAWTFIFRTSLTSFSLQARGEIDWILTMIHYPTLSGVAPGGKVIFHTLPHIFH